MMARELRLQVAEGARHGRHGGDLGVRVERGRACLGHEVERDEELPGEQVAGAQLRAQPALDQALQNSRSSRRRVAVGALEQRRATAPSRSG